MDTLRIKALLLAVKHKSLSRAAEEFSYTPSALSHSVDALEKELGVRLLERSHTGVRLSEEGERLLPRLTAVVEAEAALFQDAAALSAQKQNRLRIGTYSSISVHLLPELLNRFKEQYPEIAISIEVGNRLQNWLEEDRADVLFGVEVPDYEWLPLVRDDFVAVVPEGLFAEKQTLCYEELYPFPFIMTSNLTEGPDFSRFKELIHLTAEDDTSAVSMVREGMGVTILPSLVLKKEQQGIRTLPLEPRLCRILGLCHKKGLTAASGAGKFLHYLKENVHGTIG